MATPTQTLNHGTLQTLIQHPPDGLCVSLYMPTHRHHPGTAEDPIRFKNLLKKLEHQLAVYAPATGGGGSVNGVVADLHAMLDDRDFWNHQLDSLVVFRGGGVSMTLRIPRPLPEHTEVARSFHVKPLIRVLQSTGRYQVLCLTQGNVRLLEGDRDHLDPVSLHPDVPKDIIDALGDEIEGFHLTYANYGGITSPGTVGAAATGAKVHGHGDKSDERDKDLERYFRAVDKALWDHHGRFSTVPLYLAAPVDYHDRFRKVSKNLRLAEEGVKLHPDGVPLERLREQMADVVERQYQAEIDAYVNEFGVARGKRLALDDPHDVGIAALDGRVATLLIDADRTIGGRIDRDLRSVILLDRDDPTTDDLLDDTAELVLSTHGRVGVLPADRMPTRGGLAAVLRY